MLRTEGEAATTLLPAREVNGGPSSAVTSDSEIYRVRVSVPTRDFPSCLRTAQSNDYAQVTQGRFVQPLQRNMQKCTFSGRRRPQDAKRCRCHYPTIHRHRYWLLQLRRCVAWSVGGGSCSTQDCGSISATGLCTGPKTIPNPALVAVTATANANSADFGTAVTIIATPAPAAAMLRGTYTFLLSGSDAKGLFSIGGTFEADGSR